MSERTTARPRPERMLYSYEGPVFHYDCLVGNNFKAQTVAISPAKAKANIAYQFRTQIGKTNQYKVSLPGSLVATPLK